MASFLDRISWAFSQPDQGARATAHAGSDHLAEADESAILNALYAPDVDGERTRSGGAPDSAAAAAAASADAAGGEAARYSSFLVGSTWERDESEYDAALITGSMPIRVLPRSAALRAPFASPSAALLAQLDAALGASGRARDFDGALVAAGAAADEDVYSTDAPDDESTGAPSAPGSAVYDTVRERGRATLDLDDGLDSDPARSRSRGQNRSRCLEEGEGEGEGEASGPLPRDKNDSADGGSGRRRGMSAMQLAIILYFLTCGGPFGIESCVQAAGVLYSLIGFVAIPLLWSVPQALMAAELSLMMPENGGPIVWVRVAFGDLVGFVNSYNSIINSFLSNALYVVLFVDYFPFDVPWWVVVLMKFGFVVVVAVINVIGVDWLSRVSWLLLILVLTPFVLMILFVFLDHFFAPRLIADRPAFKEIDWSLFLSTIIWCYGGYDSVGSVAGEVGNSRSTFLLGLGLAMPANIANYLIPVAFGYMISPSSDAWQSGHFTDIGYSIGTWLGVMMIVGSVLSNFGQYNSAVATMSRLLWAMGRGRGKPLPRFVSWSIESETAVRPIMAIFLTSAVTFAVACVGNFSLLVQVNVVIRVMVLSLEFLSLVVLRFREPFHDRPFRVPFGHVGPWLLLTPPAVIAFFILYYGSWQYVVGAVALEVFLVCGYFAKMLFKTFWILQRNQRQPGPQEEGRGLRAGRAQRARVPREELHQALTVKELRDKLREIGWEKRPMMFPIVVFLIMKYKADWHYIVNAPQGGNQEIIERRSACSTRRRPPSTRPSTLPRPPSSGGRRREAAAEEAARRRPPAAEEDATGQRRQGRADEPRERRQGRCRRGRRLEPARRPRRRASPRRR
jgi:amino acid transporter